MSDRKRLTVLYDYLIGAVLDNGQPAIVHLVHVQEYSQLLARRRVVHAAMRRGTPVKQIQVLAERKAECDA